MSRALSCPGKTASCSRARRVVISIKFLIGLAPGPFIVGMLSDFLGLKLALTLAPVFALVAAVFFVLASRSYETDVGRTQTRSPEDPSTQLSNAKQST